MSRNAVFGGAVNAEGAGKPWQHLFRTGYSYGLVVTQRGAGANMSVDVAEGGALHVTTAGVPYYGWSTATENVAVTTSNPSNPRKDILVSYIDLALITTSTVNNVNALKFLVVAGTAAASPVDPIDATIQTAVGAGNPFNKLARINVSAATSTIVNANIDDLRTPMALATTYLWGGASNTKGHQVPNLADGTVVVTSGTGNVSTAMVATDAITDDKLDYPRWWQEIGRTTLSSSAATITVSSLPARKYLHIVVVTFPSGGTTAHYLRFNNDTGTSYSFRDSDAGVENSASTGQDKMGLADSILASNAFIELDVTNLTAQNKLVLGRSMRDASPPSRRELSGRWVNTSNQVNRIDVLTIGGTGSFASGSEVVVLGHD